MACGDLFPRWVLAGTTEQGAGVGGDLYRFVSQVLVSLLLEGAGSVALFIPLFRLVVLVGLKSSLCFPSLRIRAPSPDRVWGGPRFPPACDGFVLSDPRTVSSSDSLGFDAVKPRTTKRRKHVVSRERWSGSLSRYS